MKPTLRELQQWIQWCITADAAVAEPRPVCLDAVASENRELRLAIYRNAYFLRLAEALAQDFETVRWILGDPAFHSLMRRYLSAHPSTSPNIGDAGSLLPLFLAEDEQGREFPFLADLARVDWLMVESFYSRSSPPSCPDLLGNLPEERFASLRAMPDPAVRLFAAHWPVLELRSRYAASRALGHDEATPEESDLKPVSQTILIHRDLSGKISATEISESQAEILALLRGGAPLGALFEGDWPEAIQQSIPQWISHWITSGVIREFS